MSIEIEARQKAWNALPTVVLSERHTEHCRVLPNREVLLERLPKGGCVAEVGVAFGDFSEQILARTQPDVLHLIDAWQGERYGLGITSIEEKFSDRIAAKTVVVNRGLSTEVLETFPDQYFDWIYIDTDHTFRTTLAELRLADKKVRRNGRILGHDFCTGNVVKPVIYGVVQACNKFCVDQGWVYEFLTLESDGHFSFSLKREL